jgi:hypothetical protein
MRRDVVMAGAAAVVAALVCAPPAPASFPGANGLLAYEGPQTTIHLVSPDGTGDRLRVAAAREPAWSPDGTKLAYTSAVPGNDDVFVLDVARRTRTRVTSNPASDSDPAWSPDNRHIVFTSLRDGNAELYIGDTQPGGSPPQRLTSDPATDRMPAWSNDNRIAFVSNRSGNAELFVTAPVPGAPAAQITTDPLADIDPSWAPDSAQIAFTAGAGSVAHVFTVAPDGSGAHRLTTGERFERFPRWAPDGRALVLTVGSRQVAIADRPVAGVFGRVAPVVRTGRDADWAPLPPATAGQAPPASTAARSVTVTPVDGAIEAVPGTRTLSDRVASTLAAPATLPVGRDAVASVNATSGEAEVRGRTTTPSVQQPVAELVSTSADVRQTAGVAKLEVTLTSPVTGCGVASAAALLSPRDPPRTLMRGYGRVRGRHGRAGSRGTTWVVTETCFGTVTLVQEGSVTVTDDGSAPRVISAPTCHLARSRRITRSQLRTLCTQVRRFFP